MQIWKNRVLNLSILFLAFLLVAFLSFPYSNILYSFYKFDNGDMEYIVKHIDNVSYKQETYNSILETLNEFHDSRSNNIIRAMSITDLLASEKFLSALHEKKHSDFPDINVLEMNLSIENIYEGKYVVEVYPEQKASIDKIIRVAWCKRGLWLKICDVELSKYYTDKLVAFMKDEYHIK